MALFYKVKFTMFGQNMTNAQRKTKPNSVVWKQQTIAVLLEWGLFKMFVFNNA